MRFPPFWLEQKLHANSNINMLNAVIGIDAAPRVCKEDHVVSKALHYAEVQDNKAIMPEIK